MTYRCSIGNLGRRRASRRRDVDHCSDPWERKRTLVSVTVNKTIARRFFDEVLARPSEQTVDELIAPGAVVCTPTGRFVGPEGVKLASAQIGSAFPDRRVEVQALMAEGNRVTVEWTLCGTQKRERLGVPPSGRRECISALSSFRVEDGKIVEHWMTEGIPVSNSFQSEACPRLTASTQKRPERNPSS
jgi:predicted ester cyclase